MPAAPIRIVDKDSILQGSAQAPSVRLPEAASAFAERAARLGVLASRGGAAGAYLGFVHRLARAQQRAFDSAGPLSVPTSEQLDRIRAVREPPLGGDRLVTGEWRDHLRVMLESLRGDGGPLPAVAARLSETDPAALDVMAARVVAFDYPALEADAVPLLGAALQVEALRRAAAIGPTAIPLPGTEPACPACGAPPLASTLRVDVPVPGTRYLHCALCLTDWAVPRGQCSQCGVREKVAYFHLEGGAEAVKAEACDHCRGYLKILNLEKDPFADPTADDLATLALDLLMDESGYERAAPNLFFVPGRT